MNKYNIPVCDHINYVRYNNFIYIQKLGDIHDYCRYIHNIRYNEYGIVLRKYI